MLQEKPSLVKNLFAQITQVVVVALVSILRKCLITYLEVMHQSMDFK